MKKYNHHSIFYHKSKYTNKFLAFAIKINIRNTLQRREFTWENEINWLKIIIFDRFFSQKTTVFEEKTKNVILFYIVKMRIPTNFMRLLLKMVDMCQKKTYLY